MTDDNFVGISRPVEIRRSILEASKYTISNLRAYEEIKDIRNEKFKLMDEFKEEFQEIRKLVAKLKKKLPLNKLGESAKKVKLVKSKPIKKEKELELGDFERELSLLESQVNSMK